MDADQMTQYDTIKEVRRVLQLNGGMSAKQIAVTLRINTNAVVHALKVMGDAYIDRWQPTGRQLVAVYELVDVPEDCPRPERY